jgi:Undecaprenyl-phosphate glucose phosphotransferase
MKRRLNYYRFYLRMIAYLLPSLSFLSSSAMQVTAQASQQAHDLDPHTYLGFLLFTSIAWAVAAEHYRVSSVQELFHERTGIRAAFAACLATSAVQCGVLFFFRLYTDFSRVFLALVVINLFLLTLAMRAIFRSLVRGETGLLWKPNRILVIGADQFARRCAHRLVRGPLSLCRIAAYVSLPGQTIAVKGAPVYPFHAIENISEQLGVDEVLLAIPPRRYSEGPEIMKAVKRFALPVRAIMDFGDHMKFRDRIFQVGRLQVLDLTVTPAESVKYALWKRAFDIVFSAFALLVTAPLMALIAVAVRLSSPGPVLFVQERVGLNGKTFRMFKFRTMRVAPASESDRGWTTANDPRRTPLGVFLRRTNLDELPQFFNVLKGDMSVVGPRPERPRFVEKFVNEVVRYNYRHLLKAGMTGWAQVNGWRGDTSIRRRVDHDVYYLQNWSFAFDLRIIFLTLFPRYRNKNAY